MIRVIRLKLDASSTHLTTVFVQIHQTIEWYFLDSSLIELFLFLIPQITQELKRSDDSQVFWINGKTKIWCLTYLVAQHFVLLNHCGQVLFEAFKFTFTLLSESLGGNAILYEPIGSKKILVISKNTIHFRAIEGPSDIIGNREKGIKR